MMKQHLSVAEASLRRLIRLLVFTLGLIICELPLRTYGGGPCHFPQAWWGKWFQQGFSNPIELNATYLSSQGTCIDSLKEKFIVQDREHECFRCLAIHQKHDNVIQYKESYCENYSDPERLCREITGDAQLYSMFRRDNSASVPCPFHGPLLFSYDKGHGECREPVSTVDSCTDKSRLLFRFQACSDVKSEASEEQLECMATWKEGSLQYLVGRLRIMGSKSRGDEDEFRCFVYDKREDKGTQASPRSKPKDADVLLSQSGDASCNGIYSASEGSRVMRMKKKAVPRTRCQFPEWATAHRWHSMGGTRSVYLFNKDGTSLRVLEKRLPVPGPPEKVSCLQEKFSFRDPSSTTFVVHALRECYGRYLCMVIHRRSEHLIEIQFGDPSREEEMACSDLYFNRTSTPFVTLITSNPPVVECPMLGQWIIGNDKTIVTSAGCTGTRSLLVGCGGSSNVGLEIREECTRQNYQQSQVVGNSAYICHASWEVNGTLFVVAAEESNPKHRTCFAIRTSRFTPTALASRYREREGARTMQKRGGDVVVDPFFWEEETTQLRLSASHGSCKRDIEPGSGGSISFNATMMGLCSERQVQWTSGVGERVSDSGAPLLLLISVVFGQYFTSQGSS